jgi:hypothetical protein
MPLKATLSEEEFSQLHKSIHDDYEKTDDGTYRLKILDGYESQDAIAGLKSALDKERENAKNASSTLTKLKEQFGDVDPEKYRELLEAEERREEEEALKRGEYDKQLQTVNEKHNEALSKRDQREQALINVIKEAKINSSVVAALNKMGGDVDLLQPHVERQMKLIEEDGQFNARVVDSSGTVRVNGEGKPMTAEELVSEMRDQESFAKAFEAGVKSGGGTPAGDGSQQSGGKPGVIPSDLKRSDMDTRQKVDFIREHGNDVFLKLPN